jgi:feruloyl esterase
MVGSEALNTGANGQTASGWVGAIVPPQPTAKPADFNLAEGVMKYLILDPPQPEYDTMKFDYDKDPALVARWSKLADAKDADLSKFRKSGGKLIMTYGWADQILQPMMGVSYYESVKAKHGKHTDDFVRLFMMPGVAHCGGGVGPDRHDAVTAVIDWVEKGNGRTDRPDAATVPVSAGRALQGAGQHRRCGQLQLRRAPLTSCPAVAGSRATSTRADVHH